MKKEIIICDYKNRREKKIVINDLEMVEAIYILEMSGDRVLGVLYEDGRVVTFDSCDTQIISYSDDGYFPELREEALKKFPKTNKNRRKYE